MLIRVRKFKVTCFMAGNCELLCEFICINGKIMKLLE